MPVGGFAFGPCQLDTRSKQLLRQGEPVELSPRQFDILLLLVSHPGDILSKDSLIKAGWHDVIVGDSSLEKMIFQIRQRLDPHEPERYIKTMARRGYQFVPGVTRIETGDTDDDLAAVLAPHRAWTEGRAALETLERSQIARARATFEHLLAHHHGHAAFHIGMANACIMQFETTRTDERPDADALRLAITHAQEACRLNADIAEAWATLGFILERTGRRDDALAALDRAVTLEPDNWRHQFRLSAGSWGEDRLRAARRTLSQCPHLPMAHWLAASVYIARHALDRAGREVDEGLGIMAAESHDRVRFSTVAFHWLKGLLCLARGAEAEATVAFDCELRLESRGLVYSREVAANTWYAKGALHMARGDRDAARSGFNEALARVPRHPMARAGIVILDGTVEAALASTAPSDSLSSISVDAAIARAALLAFSGDAPGAAAIVASALSTSPPGNAGWLLPVEPLLRVRDAADAWAPALAALHLRAR